MRTPKASSSTKSILALMLVTLCFPTTQASGYSWEKAFWPDFALLEVGNSIQPTADGGFIIVGNALTKVDANGNELWTNEIAGNSVQQTSDGGYSIVGSTPYTEARGTDILLTKTDSFGNEQWAKTFGGNGYDAGESVQQTADGGYVIGGIIDVAQSPPVTQDLNMGLLKTDADGNEQWTKTFGGDNYDVGKSVKQANDGGYIIVGSLASSASVYLVKTDANGNEQWSKTFGVSGSERNEAYSLEKTSDGGYVIAGSTKQVGEAADVYLIKTDADGNEVWSKIFGSSSDTTGEEGYSVRQATDGGYIIAGKSSINQYDILLIKTDAEGNKAWEKTFSRGPDGGGNSVQQTSDGGYIVVGYELLRTDSDGNELEISQGNLMTQLLVLPDRQARQSAWEHYMDRYVEFKNTLASNLAASIKANLFHTRARKHESTLAGSLFSLNIPVEVFHNLIETFKKNLPVWHRYFEIRRKALGLEEIAYYDMWAPLMSGRVEVPYEKAVEMICAGLAPMGNDYVETIRKGCLEERWVDP